MSISKEGSPVYLGNTPMWIDRIEGERAQCFWMDGNSKQSAIFPLASLVSADEYNAKRGPFIRRTT